MKCASARVVEEFKHLWKTACLETWYCCHDVSYFSSEALVLAFMAFIGGLLIWHIVLIGCGMPDVTFMRHVEATGVEF